MSNPALDTDFKIGTTLVGMVTLASLGIPNPHPIWRGGVTSVKLGDHSARILGLPVLDWEWGFLGQTQRDALRTYCPGASAQVFIQTPTTENVASVPNASKPYQCQMIWPAPDNPEDPQTGRRLSFRVIFRGMVAQ